MTGIASALRSLAAHYHLRFDDRALVRAQFQSFLNQIPLLYFVLAGNAAAVLADFRHVEGLWLTRIIPGALCLIAVLRGIWWWRRRYAHFTDAQMRSYLINTSVLASILAAAFMAWSLTLYPHGNTLQRAHLSFFLAITQITCFYCLMPVRPAALGVATIGILPFTVYFLLVDSGHMVVEALNFAFVGVGMVIILNRQNRTFAELIHSQRDLRLRQQEAERLSEENRRIALTDVLSGLPNRRALIARLEHIHTSVAATPDSFAILYADLDGFKKINDDFGHELGDALIRHLSHELTTVTPRDAMLVRMGGDEFAILIEAPEATALAVHVARRVLARLALPISIAGHEMHVGASIGVAGCGDGEIDSYELLRRADTAMYRVKGEGKSDVIVYDPAFDADRHWRQRLEAEIRGGLAGDEFDVAYQPLIDARSGEMTGVEALVRWPGRPAGPLPPDEFINIAETSGLIHPLGLFVLQRACHELLGHAPLRLNVNVSPAQFRHPGFESEVAQVLRETGFPPQRLQIEITEGYLVDHPDRANRAIAAFRDMGVSVALDDFGSGFASIGYLRAFGFSCIKIDRSLTADLGNDPKATMLISGMVHLAKGLDLSVTAEGVETEAQARLLRIADCDELQGFLFGRPSRLAEVLGTSGQAVALPRR